MTCASCGADLIPGKRFCHACGAETAARCPKCGEVVDAKFRFCPECGASLPGTARVALEGQPTVRGGAERPAVAPPEPVGFGGAPAVGERKRVTVLFCDLVGSTAIAELLDPEEYRELLDRYLEIGFQQVQRFGGMVNQLAGDGLMALFGAPQAREDAPQLAVHAALAIREALHGFNRERDAGGKQEIQVRMGIHTGPVVVGPVGNDPKRDYTAVGDTTNLAARLQSLAEPGMIVISEATYRLVRGFFQMRAIGPVRVKGKSKPVAAYEVRGLREAATPIGIAAARGLTPLVGRAEELAQLEACYARLEGRLAQVVAIVGQAGSGKSRLLYEFKRRLPPDQTVVLEGRCSAMTQIAPYAPFVGMFRQFFGVAAGDDPETAQAKVAGRILQVDPHAGPLCRSVCRIFSLPPDPQTVRSADERKRETFDAVSHLVAATSERAAVVMIIEDLQWMDELSRELLDLAVARLQRARMMLVVSHRADYEPSLHAHGAFTQLHLHRLSDEETVQIVRAVVGGELPSELERRVVAKAEGNPFFAEEITRGLLEEGYVLRRKREVRLTRPVEDIRIPDTVQELVGARLDRLPPGAKRVLQVASVLGRQFSRDQLLRLLEGEDIEVERELEALERAGILHRKLAVSTDEFRFGESFTQEIAYETLLLKDRRQLHERVGLQLQAEPGEWTAERSALLAHHFSRSDNRERAIAALLRAGQDAERVPSFPAAERQYGEAWRLAEAALSEVREPDQQLQKDAMEAAHSLCRMKVIYGSSDGEETERIARRGRELAQALGSAEALAAFCTYEGMLVMGGEGERYAEGLALVELGRDRAREAGLIVVEMNISRGLAWSYFIDGRFELAQQTLQWVLEGLEERGERERLSDLYLGARSMREGVWYFCDELEHARRSAVETHELAVRVSNRTVQSYSASTLASVHWARGEFPQAQTWADRSLEVAESIGNLSAQRTAAAVALGSRIAQGVAANTNRYLSVMEQRLAGGGDMALKCLLVVETLLSLGEVKRAERFAQVAFRHAGGRLRKAVSSVALGDVMAALGPGRWTEAGQWYERGIRLATAVGARSVLAAGRLGAAELAFQSGDRAGAAVAAEEALAICRVAGLNRYGARAERLLAGGQVAADQA